MAGVTVYLAPLDSLPPGGEDNQGGGQDIPGQLTPQGASCPGGKINWDTGHMFVDIILYDFMASFSSSTLKSRIALQHSDTGVSRTRKASFRESIGLPT